MLRRVGRVMHAGRAGRPRGCVTQTERLRARRGGAERQVPDLERVGPSFGERRRVIMCAQRERVVNRAVSRKIASDLHTMSGGGGSRTRKSQGTSSLS